MGEELLRFELKEGVTSVLGVDLTDNAIPGRVLPAEAGLSGSLVLRFGGTSNGKSGMVIGCTGVLALGAGELGRDEGLLVVIGRETGAGVRRVGVDGLELGRGAKEFELEFVGTRGLPFGVEGLELCIGFGLSPGEVGVGRVLVGVDGREDTGREVGTEDLEEDVVVERLPGVEGLEVTETMLVLRIDVLLLLEK
ncbi:hypothetical protein J5N97_013954 [Dioscorea zingiberensis]|uniref:Uncharacterized protein n=1 Tax=Dioscorea zingiberensis TaxID=325984 RepID=A0A9D5HJ27_9LILI|nr:hypothetical protein J5N97_013954 [Dioscorea zingiberensis]